MRWLIACAFLVTCLVACLVACSSSPSSTPPVDAAIDGKPDVCLTCALGQICVALYDGTCMGGPSCIAKTVDCPLNACSAECEAAYCPSPYQCRGRAPCGGESPKAFNCYGP